METGCRWVRRRSHSRLRKKPSDVAPVASGLLSLRGRVRVRVLPEPKEVRLRTPPHRSPLPKGEGTNANAMATLIIDFSGKRERAVLNGGATIGRTPNNDVVIDHSAVSRTHAIIESSDGAYFISDNRSKNGTIVGKHTLRDNRRLHDGEGIEIAPAVLTFHLSDDVDIDESDPLTSAPDTAGVLMACECGAKLWIP